ncbi:MAG: GNAT family N-acetyltransferase [Crocinitomicaceae bacterium]
MKLVNRTQLDEQQWNRWCANNPSRSPFSDLAYLDAVAENVFFVLNEQKTGGLALPYIVRLGVKTLYTPVFCRWIAWQGEDCPDPVELTSFVLLHFKRAEIFTQTPLFSFQPLNRIYQKLNPADFQLHQQAKRKLKKITAENYTFSWEDSFDSLVYLIHRELSHKFENLEEQSFPILQVLASNYAATLQLKVLTLKKEATIVGGLLLIQTEDELLYLKGACDEVSKKNGGMYALMHEAIRFAGENGCQFDFGGSQVEGVRKFNLSFGSTDAAYFHYQWNQGPKWYTWLRSLRKLARV